MRLKKGDQVIVRTGKDRGKKGKLLKIIKDSNRAVVENINLIKKHQRATRDNPKGGIISMESPIRIDNIMLICPRTNKPTRVGYSIMADGTKSRISRKSKEIIG